MSETSPKSDPDKEETQPSLRRVHGLVEWLAVVALVGGLWWLLRYHPPRGPISTGLLNQRLWILVLLASGWGTAGSLIPYYVGQRGTEAVFDYYPRLKGRQWERLEAIYHRWGALTLILSGIPGLGAALLVAAGAFGIKRWVFLCWVFVARVLRNWVLAFSILLGFELFG